MFDYPKVIEFTPVQDLIDKRVRYFQEIMKNETGEDVVLLKSDPIYKAFEVEALLESEREAQDNYKISQNFVAFAEGSNLDELGKPLQIRRKEGEDDNDYRERILIGNDGYSTAGSYAGYRFNGQFNVPIPEDETGTPLADINDIVDVHTYREFKEFTPEIPNAESALVPVVFVRALFKPDLDSEKEDVLFEAIKKNLTSLGIQPISDFQDIAKAEVRRLVVDVTITIKQSTFSRFSQDAARESFKVFQKDLYHVGTPLFDDTLKGAFYTPEVREIKTQIYEKKDNSLTKIELEPNDSVKIERDQAFWLELRDFRVREFRRDIADSNLLRDI